MQFLKPIYTILFLIPFIILLASCDDNGVTGPDDPSQVPSLPDFSQLQMETGIFTHGGVAKEAGLETGILSALSAFSDVRPDAGQQTESDPFQLAAFLVNTVETGYLLHNTYTSFFTLSVAPGIVQVSGNEFLWEFSAVDPELGESMDITVIAAVQGEEVEWTAIAAADFEEGGFEEQQVIEGISAFDGSSGEWSLNFDVPEQGFTFESNAIWEADNEQLVALDISTSLTELQEDFIQNTDGFYTLDGTDAAIDNGQIQSPEFEDFDLFGDIDITQPFTVTWDTEAGSGTVSIDGHELCWDENRQAVDC